MANSLDRFRLMLDNTCGKCPKPPLKPKPLTGIDKQRLEDEEAARMWKELRK